MKLEEAPSKLVTLASAARRVGVDTKTAAKMARTGQFPKAFRWGGRSYVLEADFNRWLARLAAQRDAGHAA